MILDWLRLINDDYLANWANRGLLKRGKRLLESMESPNCELLEQSAKGNIDNYTQTLSSDGLDNLHCSCQARGPCHHLISFLLALKEIAEKETSLISVVSDGEDISALNPWIIQCEKSRRKQLGAAAIQRALRWISQGLTMESHESDMGLRATVREKEKYELIIPRFKDLSLASCSCKKTKCVHLAFVVLTSSQAKGIDVNTSASISEEQKSVANQVANWLNEFLIQGVGGISQLQLNRAGALVTELRQADLLIPSRILANLETLLSNEINRRVTPSEINLRRETSRLAAYLIALKSNVPPQDFYQLTGFHRQQYAYKEALHLSLIAVSQWKQARGYAGYTVYFYELEEGHIYHFSESRDTEIVEDWQANEAYQNASFAGNSFKDLKNSCFRLRNVWLSGSGRLSIRDNSVISDIQRYYIVSTFHKLSPRKNLHGWINDIKAKAFSDEKKWAITPIESMDAPEFNNFEQVWQSRAQYESLVFDVVYEAKQNLQTPQKLYLRLSNKLKGIFGYWQLNNGKILFFCIALITSDGITSLTEPSE